MAWNAVLNGWLVGEEKAVINHGGEDATQEWSNPIDSVIGPVAGSERGAKGSCRIHRCAGKRTAKKNTHGDREAHGEGGHFAQRASGVNEGSKHHEDEKERHHTFEQHGVQAREVRRQKHDAPACRTPNRVRDDRDENIGSHNGAEKLRDPVEKCLQGVEAPGDPKADRDRGIQMPTGNVAHGADHDCVRETGCDGDAEYAECGLTGTAQILIGTNSADAEENQRERAKELREELLGQAIQQLLQWAQLVPKFAGPRAILLN